MGFDPSTARPLTPIQGVPLDLSNQMDAIDQSGGTVDVQVFPNGQVINKSKKKFDPTTAKKFDPTTATAVEEDKPFDLGRMLALGGRAAAQGALSLPLMAADAFMGGPVKRAAGDKTPSPLDALNAFLNKNSYSPETSGERLASDAVQGATSALAGPGTIAKGLIPSLLAGGSAGLSAGGTREAGGSEALQTIAGLLGGMAPAALRGAGGVLSDKMGDIGSTVGAAFGNKNAVQRLAEDAAQRVSGGEKQFISAAEKAATNYLGPNVPVTTAQAIAQRNAMTPDVRAGATVKLQQELTGAQGATDVLPSVAKRQFTAMETPLQKIAGGADRATQDASQELAKQFRSDNAGKQYAALAATPVKVDATLEALLSSPAGRSAYTMAKDITDNANAAKLAAGLPTIPFQFTNAKGKVTGFTAQGLQDVKAALDAASTSPTLQSSLGITGSATNKVADVRTGLVDFMNKNVPGWQAARQAYSAQSEPLNQLQVGQALLDKFRNEKGAPTALTFLNARGKGEDALLKRSTGAGREVNFAPQDEAALAGIQSHLLRDEAVKRIGGEVKGGAGTGLASQDIPQLPNLLSRTAMIANFGLRMFGKSANDPVANLIAHKMANGTYSELLQRPVGDPLRTATEAMLRAALGTAATVKETQ